eukprot:5624587-Pleurochrysis_carterae.AAC.14
MVRALRAGDVAHNLHVRREPPRADVVGGGRVDLSRRERADRQVLAQVRSVVLARHRAGPLRSRRRASLHKRAQTLKRKRLACQRAITSLIRHHVAEACSPAWLGDAPPDLRAACAITAATHSGERPKSSLALRAVASAVTVCTDGKSPHSPSASVGGGGSRVGAGSGSGG